MEKLAMLVKEAEVRGVLAGLVDGGHLKLASYDDLDALTSAVASVLPDDSYNLEDVLTKTAEVIEYIESDNFQKEASDVLYEDALLAALDEIQTTKVAGDMSEDYAAGAMSELFDMVKEASVIVGADGEVYDGMKLAAAKVDVAKFMSELAGTGSAKGKDLFNQLVGFIKAKTAPTPPPPSLKDKLFGAGRAAKDKTVGAGRAVKDYTANKASVIGARSRQFSADHPKTIKGLLGAGGIAGIGAAGYGGKTVYDKYSK